jgi:predicted RNA binding protein YcfA (HicA-like mRNA interferase family)
VDSWLRRRISKQILARLGASGPDSLTEANFPEYPAAPHPTATLVTESDWSNDDRPGDINWRARMQRDIRTGYTYVYGRQVQKQIEKFGFTEKRWVSRHDERVRHTHMEANGQTVPVHSQFTVGGSRLSFPGDPLGPYEEIVNCRCVPVAVAR